QSRPRMAVPRRDAAVKPCGILQAQRASTSPLAQYVQSVTEAQTPLERLLRRIVSAPMAAAWELFRRRNEYQVVITSDYRTSLIFGALTNLFGCTAVHIVKELYLDEALLASRRARWIFRWALRGCACVISNCSAEIGAYSPFLGLPRERFRFLPWPSNLP